MNRMKVLKDRAAELFAQPVEDQDFEPKSTIGQQILEICEKVSPTKHKCVSCKKPVLSSQKFCPDCGAANVSFVERDAMVHKPGQRSGWHGERPGRTDVQALAQQARESGTGRHVGDFLSEIRNRSRTQQQHTEAVGALADIESATDEDLQRSLLQAFGATVKEQLGKVCMGMKINV